MSTKTPITVAHGDGIGPEIMSATLKILEAAGARIDIDEIAIGEKVFHEGHSAGIAPESWDSLRRTKVFLKAPITTPQGGGYKSLNVTVRKTLGLYANVRPCVSYDPFVLTLHQGMDVTIVRENEEDTYAGIEHRQTAEVTQCLKLISRPGSARICRYAFEYARRAGRRKVTCMVKDNIMKVTDGMFRAEFERIAAEYPDIESEVMIIDIGAARLADTPRRFDVIVTLNLYGDIISDIAAQITGSVGLAGSANIGQECAMFEAIHGSAPDIAGQGIANPSGLILGAVQMLVHIGQPDVAENVHNAWLKTIEDGIHTGDIHSPDRSSKKVGTEGFTEAVIERLGKKPSTLPVASYQSSEPLRVSTSETPATAKELRGVDVFLDWQGKDNKRDANELGAILEGVSTDTLKIRLITNRGVKVYPDGVPETFCTDHWRCRFLHPEKQAITHGDVLALLGRIQEAGLDFIKTEHLCAFDGTPGWSLGQGE